MTRHAAVKDSGSNNQIQVPSLRSVNNNQMESAASHEAEITYKKHIASKMKLTEQREAKQKRNEWRITKMVLAIFMSFLLCYLPITIIKVADKDVDWPGLHIFGYIMIYLSACINPIIYVIMNKQYRQAYKSVLMCKATRLLSFTQGGSSHGGKLVQMHV